MKKFQFRLTALLRIRQFARDRRRVELAESQRADVELRDRLARLGQQRKQQQRECRKAAGPGPVDLARLVEAQRYAASLRSDEIPLREQRRTLAEEVERRRQTLVEADREVRALEILRENQQETHRQEEERHVAKQLDEDALRTMTLESL